MGVYRLRGEPGWPRVRSKFALNWLYLTPKYTEMDTYWALGHSSVLVGALGHSTIQDTTMFTGATGAKMFMEWAPDSGHSGTQIRYKWAQIDTMITAISLGVDLDQGLARY